MNFKLVDVYRYWWPITVRVPDPEKAGAVIEQQFEVQFEALAEDDRIASEEAFGKLKTNRERKAHELAQFERVVKDWRGVVNDQDAEVGFSIETLRAAAQMDWFKTAVFIAYAESLAGRESRLGN